MPMYPGPQGFGRLTTDVALVKVDGQSYVAWSRGDWAANTNKSLKSSNLSISSTAGVRSDIQSDSRSYKAGSCRIIAIVSGLITGVSTSGNKLMVEISIDGTPVVTRQWNDSTTATAVNSAATSPYVDWYADSKAAVQCCIIYMVYEFNIGAGSHTIKVSAYQTGTDVGVTAQFFFAPMYLSNQALLF